ncbi:MULTISPECIES: transposase [unclassified Serratia (in: enterobacteria)]|uniref:transposase n=1 Tax=unclassified Serratia (in: enterobacteria) TaxID=2647522 RepID=UPI0030767603
MAMADFRRMAAKMAQHMQQLDAQGITEPHQIIHLMMGYTPELHQIWTGTTDKELMALAQEYPGFYRYALIMETAFEQESQKPSRPYDSQPEFSVANKQTLEQILTTAANLERGYLAYQGLALSVFDEQIIQLYQSLQVWQECVENFRNTLNADENVTPMQRDYVRAGLTRMADRLMDLQARLQGRKNDTPE